LWSVVQFSPSSPGRTPFHRVKQGKKTLTTLRALGAAAQGSPIGSASGHVKLRVTDINQEPRPIYEACMGPANKPIAFVAFGQKKPSLCNRQVYEIEELEGQAGGESGSGAAASAAAAAAPAVKKHSSTPAPRFTCAAPVSKLNEAFQRRPMMTPHRMPHFLPRFRINAIVVDLGETPGTDYAEHGYHVVMWNTLGDKLFGMSADEFYSAIKFTDASTFFPEAIEQNRELTCYAKVTAFSISLEDVEDDI
jgi:hypothetical protein